MNPQEQAKKTSPENAKGELSEEDLEKVAGGGAISEQGMPSEPSKMVPASSLTAKGIATPGSGGKQGEPIRSININIGKKPGG